MAAISSALKKLPDKEARARVFNYVCDRFFPGERPQAPPKDQAVNAAIAPGTVEQGSGDGEGDNGEIPGIAMLTDSGLRLTVRDLKAKSKRDAAGRLAHIAIYASQKLRGTPLSSSKELTPMLKDWRVYDGNTRARIAKDKGILREGDLLSLDAHATLDAEQWMDEMRDPDVAGQWKPK